jgi:hypothetical protein
LYQKIKDHENELNIPSFANKKLHRDLSSKLMKNLSKGCLSFDHSIMEEEFYVQGTAKRLDGMQIPEGLTIKGGARNQNKWEKLSTSQLGSMMEDFNFFNKESASVNRLPKSQKIPYGEMKASESGNLRRNEMEIIYENRKNMGIKKPEIGDAGMSDIGSIVDWGSPSGNKPNYNYRSKANHVRTKSSNMLEGSKKRLYKAQLTIGMENEAKNMKLERMKRCESGLDNRQKRSHWDRKMDFRSPDLRPSRDVFDPIALEQMANKNDNLKIQMSPESRSRAEMEMTPFESQVSF